MSVPLHPRVKPVSSKMHVFSSGSAQAKTRNPGNFSPCLWKETCAAPSGAASWAAPRQQLCTPLQLRFAHALAGLGTLSAAAAPEGAALPMSPSPRCPPVSSSPACPALVPIPALPVSPSPRCPPVRAEAPAQPWPRGRESVPGTAPVPRSSDSVSNAGSSELGFPLLF